MWINLEYFRDLITVGCVALVQKRITRSAKPGDRRVGKIANAPLEFLHLSPFFKGAAAFFAAGGLH